MENKLKHFLFVNNRAPTPTQIRVAREAHNATLSHYATASDGFDITDQEMNDMCLSMPAHAELGSVNDGWDTFVVADAPMALALLKFGLPVALFKYHWVDDGTRQDYVPYELVEYGPMVSLAAHEAAQNEACRANRKLHQILDVMQAD